MKEKIPTHITGKLKKEITVHGKRYNPGDELTVPISFIWEDYFDLPEKIYLTAEYDRQILEDTKDALEAVEVEHLEDIERDKEYEKEIEATKKSEEYRAKAEEEALEEAKKLVEEDKD